MVVSTENAKRVNTRLAKKKNEIDSFVCLLCVQTNVYYINFIIFFFGALMVTKRLFLLGKLAILNPFYVLSK